MKKAVLIVLLFCPLISFAQFKSGNGLGLVNATGDFGDTHNVGIAVSFNAEFKLSKLAVVGEFAWTTWSADDIFGLPLESADAYSLLAGLKYDLLGPLYLETRAGYYFKDLDEVAIIPAVGLRFNKFDFNAGANLKQPTQFLNLRVAYFWSKD